MGITITLHELEVIKYPNIHTQFLEELEDRLCDVLKENGFENFSIEDSYTGNSMRRMPKPKPEVGR